MDKNNNPIDDDFESKIEIWKSHTKEIEKTSSYQLLDANLLDYPVLDSTKQLSELKSKVNEEESITNRLINNNESLVAHDPFVNNKDNHIEVNNKDILQNDEIELNDLQNKEIKNDEIELNEINDNVIFQTEKNKDRDVLYNKIQVKNNDSFTDDFISKKTKIFKEENDSIIIDDNNKNNASKINENNKSYDNISTIDNCVTFDKNDDNLTISNVSSEIILHFNRKIELLNAQLENYKKVIESKNNVILELNRELEILKQDLDQVNDNEYVEIQVNRGLEIIKEMKKFYIPEDKSKENYILSLENLKLKGIIEDLTERIKIMKKDNILKEEGKCISKKSI